MRILGVKFNDRDLLGIPIGITVGPRGIKNNRVDVVLRQAGDKFEVALDQLEGFVLNIKKQKLEVLKP